MTTTFKADLDRLPQPVKAKALAWLLDFLADSTDPRVRGAPDAADPDAQPMDGQAGRRLPGDLPQRRRRHGIPAVLRLPRRRLPAGTTSWSTRSGDVRVNPQAPRRRTLRIADVEIQIHALDLGLGLDQLREQADELANQIAGRA
jgi:hypothetical protein